MQVQVIPENTKEQINMIRKMIKAKVPTVSVKNGRGTAWGWVEIEGSQEYGNFTEQERKVLREQFKLCSGGNFCVISPEEREYTLKMWFGTLTQEDEDKRDERIKWSLYD